MNDQISESEFQSADPLPETLILTKNQERLWLYLRNLWNYRDLLCALVERDIKVRYKQTIFGILWVILPPLVNSMIFYIIFVRVVKMPTQGLPPLLFFLSGLIPWNCFSNGVSQAASSLEGNAGLISKVYFPRLIAPMAGILTGIFDFTLSWGFFNIVALIWGYWTWLFIPFTIVLLGLQLGASMGLGIFFSVLNAQYRDIRCLIPWLIQLGMWMTPVVWPMDRLLSTRLESVLSIFLYLNPMAGVIESYRALLSGSYIPYKLLAVNFIVAILIFSIGLVFFRNREQKIIDLL